MIKEGECMVKQKVRLKKGQDGNIMLITTIVILVLTVIIATCINVSSMQLDLSMLERNTSNTYYLAKSGVEKQVDIINKSLDVEMTEIVTSIANMYINQLAAPTTGSDKLLAMKAESSCDKYNAFYYDNNKLSITSSNLGTSIGLKGQLQKEIYKFVEANYINKPALNYEVQSDHVDNVHYKTNIKVKAEAIKINVGGGVTTDQTGFKLIATAETKNTTTNEIYDTQTVEAQIALNMPDKLPNEIHEKYTWAANPPEILNSALISFSDVVVTSGGTLNINNGDIQVKGGTGQSDYTFDPTTNRIQISAGTFSDTTQTGGIIVSNGGKLKVQSGDIACINNVVATNGWATTGDYGLSTSITVSSGDIIANTIGIVDDYYDGGINQSPFNESKQGKNLSIDVKHNVFVSNDVMISRWVKNSGINIAGTIFGVNDGSDTGMKKQGTNLYSTGTTIFLDPNSSSGVFSQGENTTISAYRILVNGQPYVTLAEDTLPMKLWESVGEPFDGIALWEGYKTGEESTDNANYLDTDSPFYNLIKRNKIKICDNDIAGDSYAPAKISANGITTTGSAITNQIDAKALFLRGFGSAPVATWSMSQYTSKGNYSAVEDIITQTKGEKKYYRNIDGGSYSWYEKQLRYGKTYTSTTANIVCNYLGLRGYMTAKRSVFYGAMDSTYIPQLLTFDEVIGTLPNTSHAWCYSNPIEVITSGDKELSISQFYVDEDGKSSTAKVAYPSIIVNAGEGTLTIKTTDSSYNTFNGIIISKGDVRIQGTINMNGSLIIKGKKESANPTNRETRMTGTSDSNYSPGLVIGNGSNVTINHDANMLLKVNTNDDVLYRQILDALKITQYNGNSDVKKILGPYSSGKLNYSVGKVFYTTASTLEVQTQGIKAQIKSLKKMR